MKFTGKLTSWDDENGSGFISTQNGGDDIFVDSTVFPYDGKYPRKGEVLQFEVESKPDGKKRAVNVMRRRSAARLGKAAPDRMPQRQHRDKRLHQRRNRIRNLLLLLAIVGAVAYYLEGRRSTKPSPPPDAMVTSSAVPAQTR